MGNKRRRAFLITFLTAAFIALVFSCAVFSAGSSIPFEPVYAALEAVKPAGEGTKTSPYIATAAAHLLWLSGNVVTGDVYVAVDGALDFKSAGPDQFPLATGTAKLRIFQRGGAEKAELINLPRAKGGIFLPNSIAELTGLKISFGSKYDNVWINNESHGILTDSMVSAIVSNCSFSVTSASLYFTISNAGTVLPEYDFGMIGSFSNGTIRDCDADVSGLKMSFRSYRLADAVTVSVGGFVGKSFNSNLQNLSVTGSGLSVTTADQDTSATKAVNPIRWKIGGAVGFVKTNETTVPSASSLRKITGVSSSVPVSVGGSAEQNGNTDFDYTIGGCFGSVSLFGWNMSGFQLPYNVGDWSYQTPGKIEIEGVTLREGSDAASSGNLNVIAGGVFGGLSAQNVSLKNLSNTGSVAVAAPVSGRVGDVIVGGIGGHYTSQYKATLRMKMSNAINTGELTHPGANLSAEDAKLYLGGIFGYAERFLFDKVRNAGRLTRTKETESADGATFAVGGLVGGIKGFTSNAEGENEDLSTTVFYRSENLGAFADFGKGTKISGGLAGRFYDEKNSDYPASPAYDKTRHYRGAYLSASHGKGYDGGLFGGFSTESLSGCDAVAAVKCLVTSEPASEKAIVGGSGCRYDYSETNYWYSDSNPGVFPFSDRNAFAASFTFQQITTMPNYSSSNDFSTDRKLFNDIRPNEATAPAPKGLDLASIRADSSFSEGIRALFLNLDTPERPSFGIFAGGSGTENRPFVVFNEKQFLRIRDLPDNYLPGQTRYFKIDRSFSVSVGQDTNFSLKRISLDFNRNTLTIENPGRLGSLQSLFPSAEASVIKNGTFSTKGGFGAFTLVKTAADVGFDRLILDFVAADPGAENVPALFYQGSGISASNVVTLSATDGGSAPRALPAGTWNAKNVFVATTYDAPNAGASPNEGYIYLRDPRSFGASGSTAATDVTFGLAASFISASDQRIKLVFTQEYGGSSRNPIAFYGDGAGSEAITAKTPGTLYLSDDISYPNVYPRLTRNVKIYDNGALKSTVPCYLTQKLTLEASLIDGYYYIGRYSSASGDGFRYTEGPGLSVEDFCFYDFRAETSLTTGFEYKIHHRYQAIRKLDGERVFDKTTVDTWADTVNGTEYAGKITVTSGGAAIRDAGTYEYEIEVYKKGDFSHPLGRTAGTISVTPLGVAVTPTAGGNLIKIYDGTTDVNVAYTFDRTDVVHAGDFTGKLAIGGADAGEHTVEIGTLTLGANYLITLEYAVFTIRPMTLGDFRWTTPESDVYDKATKPVTVSAPTQIVSGDVVNISITAIRNGVASEIRNAGEYLLAVAEADNPNYIVDTGAQTGKMTYVVKKATANVTVKQYSTFVYDAEFHFPAVVFSGTDEPFSEEEITLNYRDGNGNVFSGARDAGTYGNLTVSFTPFTGNFNEIETKLAHLTIEKRTVDVRFPGIEAVKYTGRPVVLTAEVYGMLANEKITAKIKYARGGTSVTTPVEPGEYTATVATDSLLLDGAVPKNYRLEKAVSADFTIGKADMRDPQITVGQLTYMDETLSNLKVEARFRDVNNKYISSVRTEILTPDRKLEAGTISVSIRWTAVGDIADYYNPYEKTVEVTVNRKKITISAVAASGQYGDAPPAFRYTGGEEVVMVGDGFEGALALDRTDVMPAGEYQIGIGSLTAGKNYEILFVPATYTVRPRRVSGSFGTIPYFVYDGGVKRVAFEIYNKLPEDELNARIVYYRAGTAESAEPLNAGSYRVVAEGLDDPNYTFGETLPQAQFSIARATVEGLVFPDKTVDYDGRPHSIAIAELPDYVEAVYSKTAIRDAGIYPVTASFTLSENYAPIAPMTATLTIQKATVSAFDFGAFQDLCYQGAPFAPRVTATDAKSDDRVEAVYRTDRTIFEPGTYTGRITDVADNNYTLAAPVDFSFTVGKRPVRLRLKRELVKSFDGTTDLPVSIGDFNAEGLLEGVSIAGEPVFRLAEAGDEGGAVAILIEGLRLEGEKKDFFELETDGNFAEVRLTAARDGTGNSISSPSLNLLKGSTLKFEAGDASAFEKTVKGIDGTFRIAGVYDVVLTDADGNPVELPPDAVAVFKFENTARLTAVYVETSEGLKRAEFTAEGDFLTVRGASGTIVLIERPAVYDALALIGIVLGVIAAVAVVLLIVRSRAASKRRKER